MAQTKKVKNPLLCGCGAMGTPGLNLQGTRMEFTNIHAVLCPLHSSAPDLFVALKTLLEAVDCDPFRGIAGVPSAIARAKNAIAKAESIKVAA